MANYNSGFGSFTEEMREEYYDLLQNPDLLNEWLEENYEKVVGFDIFYDEIVFLLDFYNPGMNADEIRSPKALAKLLSLHLLDTHTKLNKFNVELGELPEVDDAKTLGKIENHKKKVFKVIEEYEEKLRKANEEVILCKEYIAHLDSQLTGALIKIQSLERGLNTGFLDESVDEAMFIADLQGRVAATDCLNSSMKKELKQTRDLNMQLQLLITDMRRQSVAEQEECMEDLAESAKKEESRLDDTIKEILEITNSTVLVPDEETANHIIEEWKKKLKESIEKNQTDIDMLLDNLEDQTSELNGLKSEENMLREKLEDVKFQANRVKEIIEIFEEEIDRLHKNKEKITVHLDHARADCQREIENASQYFSAIADECSFPQQCANPLIQVSEATYVYETPQTYAISPTNYRKPKSTWESRRRIVTDQWNI